ncbi:MAG: Hsp33 family molecular chaperone HslO [Vallitalea sp.]|jgi:molecular chaperone Hsp33|nr:Hsp33 family molecular chaperone HslO [Vallitalea sp.]
MKDYIVRATAIDNQIRAFAVNTTEMVEEARSRHNTSPVVTAALGRLMTAASMMGSMLKNEKDLLTLQIRGDGPIQGLVVTADSKANVKGYPFVPVVDIPLKENGKLDVSTGLGIGIMNIIKDIGLKDPYVGQTHLVSGEIAEDLTYYFATSEQVPSAVALGVLVDKDYSVKQSGGYIIQLLPNAEEEIINKLEENIKRVSSITNEMEEGKTPEDILEIILGDMGLQILEKMPTKFHCNCTKDRVQRALISVGKKDLQEMIDDGETIELNCHFCNTKYLFTIDELKELVSEISS